MKTKLLLYITLIISVSFLSCSDRYVSDETISYIHINQRNISIIVGESYRIVPYFDSEETASKRLHWSVNDTEIASIVSNEDNHGIVTGTKPGKSIIKVVSDDGQNSFHVSLEVTDEPPVVRILTIGDSFSEDAVENYLYNLAKSAGKEVIIGNLYTGNSSLELHWENASENRPAYQLRKISRNGDFIRLDNTTIFQALKNENWDYISFQEVSHLAGLMDGYQEYLPRLLEYAKRFATNPEAKYLLHQTWAYSKDSDHQGFNNYDRDQEKMYDSIVDAVWRAAEANNIDMIIPSGTAIQNGRTSYVGDGFTRDGAHLDLGRGRFLAASTWYESIFGGILDNPYYSDNLLRYDTELVKRAAYDAVRSPNEITDMVDFKERGPNEFILEYPLFIDLGPILSPKPFNNFARWQDGSVANLEDAEGNNSYFILKAGMPFHDGVIERDMENLLGFPKTASQDAFFNDGLFVPGGSSLILSNLNTAQKYSFVLYATINDKGTQTEYRVSGKNEGVGYLDTDHNLSKVVVINDIEPDDNGEITILVKQGPNSTQYFGYYGLNTMIVLPGGTSYEFPSNEFVLEKPVFVDFGLWLSNPPFNNLRDSWDPRAEVAKPVLNMIDRSGNNTGFAIATTDGFSAVNDQGAWGNLLGLPDEVAVDAFWGDRFMPDGELTISNLNKSQKYDFVLYGSRRDSDNNLETQYEVIGENSGSGTLNAANNVGEVVIIKGIAPDEAGNIVIKVSAGPNNDTPERFYYLNTLIFGPEGFDFSEL